MEYFDILSGFTIKCRDIWKSMSKIHKSNVDLVIMFLCVSFLIPLTFNYKASNQFHRILMNKKNMLNVSSAISTSSYISNVEQILDLDFMLRVSPEGNYILSITNHGKTTPCQIATDYYLYCPACNTATGRWLKSVPHTLMILGSLTFNYIPKRHRLK